MRRGHPGNSGGWRAEGPRHFRPRGGGTPHFRPSRGYGHPETNRFPPPGPRSFPGPGQYQHNVPQNSMLPENHDRNNFRSNRQNNHHRNDRGPPFGQSQEQRKIFPLLQRMRQGDMPDHSNSYPDSYYDNNRQRHVTTDIDLRSASNMLPNRERVSPWVKTPYYEERSPAKSYINPDILEHNKPPLLEFPGAGHRPSASDHYGGSHGSNMDNSNTFSRSVDDTVNIVRKRLLSRESQPSMDNPLPNQNESEKNREPTSSYSNINQQQTSKKKSQNTQRLKNVKSNCDKIKTKIVHQLFMMDKDKIHKLMDNPNSSSKFEYAISSLVTESQNSFNRHLRSVAEKSLCGTSTEFIHQDTNTIYEDTFMKQMQCLLDPQDTVLLEDIKPMVLAELSKVLQLDDFQGELVDSSYQDDQSQYDQYHDESYNYENQQNYEPYSPVDSQENYYEEKPYARSKTPVSCYSESNTNYSDSQHEHDSKPLFERRKSRKSREYSHSRRSSSERRRKERRSMDNKSESSYTRSRTPIPMFDPDAEQLTDEEDPFAELDKQYHVAVDHNFIESYDMSSPQHSVQGNTSHSPILKSEVPSKPNKPQKPTFNIRPLSQINIKSPEIPPEIDSQLQSMAKSPLKFSASVSNIKNEIETPKRFNNEMSQESFAGSIVSPSQTKQSVQVKKETSNEDFVNQNQTPEPQLIEAAIEKSESTGTMIKSSTPSHSRKRSTDQRPSHRKEKRKKSETSDSSQSQHKIDKNLVIRISDCAAKSSDKHDAPKTVSHKDKNNKESSKDSKKVDSIDKGYSDKYVKRKESSKKSRDDPKSSDTKKKHDSSSSSHSILSPSDSSNTSISLTAVKPDGQNKLKSIDIFGELPRKQSNVHHAHRNTAPTPVAKPIVETKPVVLSRKVTKRHIATQVLRKVMSKEIQTTESKCSSSRFSQTDRKKLITRGSQTDPISIKSATKSKDAFERMKEIDIEIQSLLQEKFKLYNSLESKESYPSTMQSLGMAVLNMNPVDTGNSISEDQIVEEFTSIPEDELAQIALESVQEEKIQEKRPQRQRSVPLRKRSASPLPTLSATRSKRNTKTPNISLIEQIITDDRPLEEIISLDDLESTPKRKKTQKADSKKKKATKKTKASNAKHEYNLADYDIKECSVRLLREDLSKLQAKLAKQRDVKEVVNKVENETLQTIDEVEEPTANNSGIEIEEPNPQENVLKPAEVTEPTESEEAVNDIQFDMLDVSEDIVIGDVCEVKCDKDTSDTSTATVSEEIILDNSQSSIEDVVAPEASGGGCKTYDYSADENLRRDSVTVSGNGDAVLAIESIENDFLAASLDGNVYHFSGDGQLLNTLRGSNLPVTCLTIVKEKYGTTVYTGSLDSRIRYYDLENGLEKGPECNVLSPIQTMDRAWGTIFVGTRTGFVLQFECKNNMLIPVSSVKFSEQSILALRAMKEGPRKVLLVASRSEAVSIRDAQTGLLLRNLDGPKMTVYSLLFEDGKVFCGTSSNQIHVFDYSSGSHVGAHEGGKGAVCLRAGGGLVFAGCYDGCVYVYRDNEPKPLAQLRGPSLMLLSLALVGTKIVAGYKDRSLYIWKIPLSIVQEMIL